MKLIFFSLFNIIISLLFCGGSFLTLANTEKVTTHLRESTIVDFPGLYQGNQFIVDGPFWYDGNAVLEQYNHNQLKISISMRVPNIVMVYKIIDNRINISIGLVRGTNSKFNLIINDIYGKKHYFIPNVKLLFGEIAGGWFSGPKNYIKIIAINQEFTFIVQEPGRLSLSSNMMPGSLSLIKQN